MRVGFHVSILGSISNAIDRAVEMGINTFQMFTRNPRGWQFNLLNSEEVSRFKTKLNKTDIEPVFVHMPYLPNLASPKKKVYTLSVRSLVTELERCDKLGIPFLVTHLGSHLGSGRIIGVKRTIDAINYAFSKVKGETALLLENTAGTTNSTGSLFEDVAKVIDDIVLKERIGICFDTCHAFAAGYDLRSVEAVEEVLDSFDSILGLRRLHLIHMNDSKGDLGSHHDRHEHIGLGKIGEEGFKAILDSKFGDHPIIMETPVDDRSNDRNNLMRVIRLCTR